MKVEKDKVVSISYQLITEDDNGEKAMIEEVTEEHPFLFLFGHQGLPEEFEQKLKDLNEGDEFSFSIAADNTGYGEYDEEKVVDFPKTLFVEEGGMPEEELVEGNTIFMRDENDESHRGTIVQVEGDTVIVDFNHALAGLDLEFQGKVLNVRDASAEEIEHGHVHGEGGHHH